jgi:hypothetical protein
MTITITIRDNPEKPGFCDLEIAAEPGLSQRLSKEEAARPAVRAMNVMLAALRKPAAVTLKALEFDDGTVIRPRQTDPAGN